MKFKAIFIFFLTSFVSNLEAHTYIYGIVKGNTVPIRYFRPFKNFAQRNLFSICESDSNGKFTIRFDIQKPTMTQVLFGNCQVSFLLQPNDSIRIEIDITNSYIEAINSIKITGNNSEGHTYYNRIFDQPRIKKFDGIRDIFTHKDSTEEKILFDKIEKELLNQTKWIDSLKNIGSITPIYADYMKTDIKSVLAWEIGVQIDRYYGQSKDIEKQLKASKLKQMLFDRIDPLDTKLYTCIDGHGYYITYFEEIYKRQTVSVDSSQIIIDDTPFYALAPTEIQKYLWGQSILSSLKYAPDKYDFCEVFKKYQAKYVMNEYIDYLEKQDLCNPSKKLVDKDIKFYEPPDKDFLMFLTFYFSGRRAYIDLWATWCGPCISEFRYYDKDFRDLMSAYKVELAYISIDTPDMKERWKSIAQKSGLKGRHFLANKDLQQSIKEIIYDNQNVTIPRYIIIDEKGRVLTIDGKRPSDPLFKQEIINFFDKKKN